MPRCEEEAKRRQLFYLCPKDLINVRAESFIVVEHPSGQIVTGHYFRKVLEIASLTKIMTFYATLRLLQLHQLPPQQQIVQVEEHATDITGTTAELSPGDQYSVEQLLYALMLPSGNDAALALAHWGASLLGGPLPDFLAFMNKCASELGMKHTNFANPHGLPHPLNTSTAEDLSLLINKCLVQPLFRTVINCRKFRCTTTNSGVRREVQWENTNKLLRRPGFGGVKTGVTATAGPCLASLYSTHHRHFVVVLLRTSKLSRRFKETRWILRLCLRKLAQQDNLNFGPAIAELGREDPELDSDNSEDEEEFRFDSKDPEELQRRHRIIRNEL